MAPVKKQQQLLVKTRTMTTRKKRLTGLDSKHCSSFTKKPQPQPLLLQARRRVRVVFEDPDATDSDSDDDGESGSLCKRFSFEVLLGKSPTSSASAKQPAKPATAGTKPSGYRGVRLRKWGKWAAEIRNPFTGTRQWLGTFNTADEASAAYQAASLRFADEKHRRRLAATTPTPTLTPTPTTPTTSSSSSTSASQFSHPSPSSVLDVAEPTPKPPEPIPAEPDLLLDDPVFYQELLKELELTDIDPMDFGAGLEALDIGDVPVYCPDEFVPLSECGDEDLADLDEVFPEMSGCDFMRGIDEFLQTVDFCV